jgi:hypothetical protein
VNKVLTVNGTMYIDGSAQDRERRRQLVHRLRHHLSLGHAPDQELEHVRGHRLRCVQHAELDVELAHARVRRRRQRLERPAHQSQTGTGNSILLNSARFQGALYATYGIDIATTSNADGPLDGAPGQGRSERQLDLARSSPVRPRLDAGNPVAYAEPQPPVYEG